MDIEVLINKLPRFKSGLDTSYDIDVPQSASTAAPTIIELPEIVDEMKQDKYEVTISSSEGREEEYASFVSYQSRQNALSFAPREGNRGQTYYFTLILADPNQDR